MRRAMASSPAQLQFLPRAVGNHRVSEREFRSTGLSVGTALTAAVAGGIQAGFYALCGGLALDWDWSAESGSSLGFLRDYGYRAVDHWLSLYRGRRRAAAHRHVEWIRALIVRTVDYGGLILGLWLCPWFNSALGRQEDAGNDKALASSS